MPSKIKILFCEDNPNDYELMKLELDKSNIKYEPKWVDTKDGFVKELKEFVPDIILCDYSMPSFNGMEAFKLLAELNLHIPFIVVTGTLSEELALSFLNEGVDDFILKSSFKRVPKAIEKAIEKKNAQNTIKQNQANLKIIFDNASEGFILTDENMNVRSFNKKAEEIIINFNGNALMVSKSVFDTIGESKRDLIQSNVAKKLNGLVIQYDASYIEQNGNTGWVNFSVDYVKIENNVTGICITLRDVTALKLAEEKMLKANRMYLFISQINQSIMRVNNRQRLFKRACQIAFDFGGFRMAWIMLIDKENKKLNLLEEVGTMVEDVPLIREIPFDDDSSTSFILRTGTYYVCNDIEKDVNSRKWKHLTRKKGIRSLIILPIKKSGIILGTFTLFSTELNFFDKEEIRLLEEVAEDLSFAVDFFEKEILRKEAEKNLLQSEAYLAEAQKLAKLGSWSFELKADKVTWSKELYSIFDTSKKQFNQTHGSFLHLIDEEDRERALQTSIHTQKTGEPFTIEYNITTPKGEKRIIQEYGYGEKDAKGKVIRLFGTAQDITERKKAEIALQNSNIKLQELSSHLQSIREEERTHIAREIHDELGQQLTALKMDIAWIKHKQNVPNKETENKLNEMLDFSDSIIKTIRRISSDLRPAIIDDLGLIPALEWKCNDFEDKHNLSCQFKSTIKERKFESNFSITVFRILQESLTNVLRHAQAKSVKVTVSENENELIMEITDDGKGMDKTTFEKIKTLGITGMKERANLMGGKLIINSEPNEGTKTTLLIPFIK